MQKRIRLALVATLLALVLPSLSQAADARTDGPGSEIIGGGEAGEGEFPFMAAVLDLTIDGTDFDRQFCGGSLIAADWVLTAAHCVEDIDAPDDLAVVVGRTELSSDQGERRGVEAVEVHPDFDPRSLANDVALLQLTSPVDIEPIDLADVGEEQFEADGKMLTVIGWGTVTAKGRLSFADELQKVEVPVVGDATCSTLYGKQLDAATQVCAGAPAMDSCLGDSGGPLFATDGSRTQVGIVSWGRGCGHKRFPGVYSEVNNPGIRGWITDTAEV